MTNGAIDEVQLEACKVEKASGVEIFATSACDLYCTHSIALLSVYRPPR